MMSITSRGGVTPHSLGESISSPILAPTECASLIRSLLCGSSGVDNVLSGLFRIASEPDSVKDWFWGPDPLSSSFKFKVKVLLYMMTSDVPK